jgi:DNA-binding transcriptional regulator YiaG
MKKKQVEQWSKIYNHERPIGQLREALKLSQEEFADAIDANRNRPSRWETGAAKPSGTTVLRICSTWPRQLKALGLGALDLLENSP